jgi:hypothetical protein
MRKQEMEEVEEKILFLFHLVRMCRLRVDASIWSCNLTGDPRACKKPPGARATHSHAQLSTAHSGTRKETQGM